MILRPETAVSLRPADDEPAGGIDVVHRLFVE